jgi:hypothetical protein
VALGESACRAVFSQLPGNETPKTAGARSLTPNCGDV